MVKKQNKDEVILRLPADGSIAIFSGSVEANKRFYSLIITSAFQILDRMAKRSKAVAAAKKRKRAR